MIEIRNCGAKRRQWIDEAESIIGDASDVMDVAEASKSQETAKRKRRRAAKLYLKAAVLYRQAGLGVMAISSFEDAADAYADNGDVDDVTRCEARIAEIETYLDGEE